jgi:hypothetical protein
MKIREEGIGENKMFTESKRRRLGGFYRKGGHFGDWTGL